MKIKYVFMMFLLAMPVWGIALKNNQELFLQAVQLQQDKKYNQALSLYEQINRKGRAVFYNMGLIYYALDQFPQALVYLQRAQRNAPSHEYALIASQISAINKQLGKPEIASYWYTLLAGFVSSISLLVLQLVFLAFWCFLWVRFFSIQKSKKRTLIYSIWGLLFVVACTGLFVKTRMQRYTGGVVIEKEAPLRAGPQRDYDVVGALTSADQVAIIKKVDNWYLVKYGPKRGWVLAEHIMPIDE